MTEKRWNESTDRQALLEWLRRRLEFYEDDREAADKKVRTVEL